MMDVRRADSSEIEQCLSVRRIVFVEGQNVAEDLEVDGLDPMCIHFIALDGVRAIGTARLRVTDDGRAKAERVAVIEGYRGKHVGAALMGVLEATAKAEGHAKVVLSAQVQVIPFYEARGYLSEGPEFEEAGILHRKMSLTL